MMMGSTFERLEGRDPRHQTQGVGSTEEKIEVSIQLRRLPFSSLARNWKQNSSVEERLNRDWGWGMEREERMGRTD